MTSEQNDESAAARKNRLDEHRRGPELFNFAPDGYVVNDAGGKINEASRAVAALLVETMNEGVGMQDENGVITYVNPALCRMFGYSSEDLIGRRASEFLDSAGRELIEEQITGRARGERTTCEIQLVTKDGRPMVAHISAVSLLDKEGRFAGSFAVITDVTELKRAQERLVQAERLAAIGEAMTGLAHESRNALQRSQAGLNMLARRVADQPAAVQLIADIQEAQDDLHKLYETVREYAAPIMPRVQMCNLREIVQEAWGHLEALPARGTASLRQNYRHSGGNGALDLRCEVDRSAVQRLFRNLLENSLAACPAPAEIEVEYTAVEIDSRPAVRIAVRDNGPGLTPEQRRRLFEPFYTTKTHGTGLGLAIAKRILEAHRGHIAIGENRPGAEIILVFPRRQT